MTLALLRDCWYLPTLTQLNTTQCCFPKPSLDAGVKAWKPQLFVKVNLNTQSLEKAFLKKAKRVKKGQK